MTHVFCIQTDDRKKLIKKTTKSTQQKATNEAKQSKAQYRLKAHPFTMPENKNSGIHSTASYNCISN